MSTSGSPSQYDSPEVRKLISRAKKGDEAAFTQLVRTYEDLVYKFAMKLCRDQDKAEEAFQDTFVNVFKRLGQFDGRSKFSSWLYTIVSNNCLMKLRRSKLARSSVSLDSRGSSKPHPHEDHADGEQTVPPWKETPLDDVLRGELRETLDEAITRLPATYRAVFLLRDIEDRSARETAKIQKIAVPAVKSRLHRARAFLRDELSTYMAK